jgi:hypothetical protein
MSDSVALVAVERVAQEVSNQISVNKPLVEKIATRMNISTEEAKKRVVESIARMALRMTDNNEEMAVTAIVVVDGRQNRLPQCARLLKRHPRDVVSVAYEIKSEMSVSTAPLRFLCQIMERTDADKEGEASRIQGLLDELAMKATSKKQEWAFHHRIREEVNAGRLIETVVEEILDELANRANEDSTMSEAYNEAYWRLSQ